MSGVLLRAFARGFSGSFLVMDGSVGALVGVVGPVRIVSLVEDVHDVPEDHRDVVHAGQEDAERAVRLDGVKAGPSGAGVRGVQERPELEGLILDVSKNLARIVELLVEHDSPLRSGPEGDTSDVPASTVAETTGMSLASGGGTPERTQAVSASDPWIPLDEARRRLGASMRRS